MVGAVAFLLESQKRTSCQRLGQLSINRMRHPSRSALKIRHYRPAKRRRLENRKCCTIRAVVARRCSAIVKRDFGVEAVCRNRAVFQAALFAAVACKG